MRARNFIFYPFISVIIYRTLHWTVAFAQQCYSYLVLLSVWYTDVILKWICVRFLLPRFGNLYNEMEAKASAPVSGPYTKVISLLRMCFFWLRRDSMVCRAPCSSSVFSLKSASLLAPFYSTPWQSGYAEVAVLSFKVSDFSDISILQVDVSRIPRSPPLTTEESWREFRFSWFYLLWLNVSRRLILRLRLWGTLLSREFRS